MDPQNLKILSVEKVTHDVRRFRLVKPPGISFTPGQAADISLNKEGWEKDLSP